jgi:CBS domain-containing protein
MDDAILLKDVKTSQIIHVEKDASVWDAAQMMKEKGISSVVVLDGKVIAGILTERDIVHKVVCNLQDPRATSVSSTMTSPVEKIDANESLVDAARLMRQKGVKKLIVTEGREVRGIISERDIIELDPALHAKG